MTFRGFIKTIIGLVIIGAAVAIGWAVATATNPYTTGAATATQAVGQANQGAQGAARPTAIPTFTPATNSGTGANPTPGANGQSSQGATGTGTGQARQQAAAITGTVTTYDTGNKILTIKDASGKSQDFDASNARVTKAQKLASADFSSALGSNGIVLLTGQKGSDSTYTATSLILVDTAAFGGGNGGTGGFGGGRAGANGTPGANGGTGTNGTPGAGGTGTGRGNNGTFAGAGGAVIVRGGTLQGNKFTGTDATGQAITATISDSTLLEKQASGTADDLKAGANVSIISRPAVTDAPPQAVTIALS